MAYFSERERGLIPRTTKELNENCWKGIVSAIQMRIDDGSFGLAYPSECPQSNDIIGTHVENFKGAAAGMNLPWPSDRRGTPGLYGVMDLIEFCHEMVAKPIPNGGCYYNHTHLSFNAEQGEEQFRQAVNQIFSRHGMAFELLDTGQVGRIPYPVLHEELTSATFDTGDDTLDDLLETARTNFVDPDSSERPARWKNYGMRGND